MKDFLKHIKWYALCASICLILGFIGGMLFNYPFAPSDKEIQKQVKVIQISGEDIEHHNFKVEKDKITFTTQSQGVGVIQTEIPKVIIPEAKYWMERVNCVQLTVGALYADQQFNALYGVGYYRRWGRFSAGGSVLLARKYFGAQIGGQIWF